MLRFIAFFMFFCLTANFTLAQQQGLFTQFMFHKASINPAYVGHDEYVTLNAIYRQQWLGLDGAPSTQVIHTHGAIQDQNAGLGFEINRQSLGVSQYITLHGNYAYKISLYSGEIRLGARASYRNYRADFSDPRLRPTTDLGQDPAIQNNQQIKGIWNAGLGGYYSNDEFYIGISIPRLFRANIDFEDDGLNGLETTHIYGMAGVQIDIDNGLSLIPQLLVRYVPDIPIDFDLNFGMKLDKRHVAAVSYRAGGAMTSFGESIALIFGTSLSRELFASLAYDISLTQIRQHASGSIELSVNYQFGSAPQSSDYFNPRFF